MIPGGLVEKYGLRSCIAGCAGPCKKAHVRADGSVKPAPDCELMNGPPPLPGVLSLSRHTDDQLARMIDYSQHADHDLSNQAARELRRRNDLRAAENRKAQGREARR